MKTGHQLCNCIRNDFTDLRQHFYLQCFAMGAIDAPQIIAAGSHEQVRSIGRDFTYGLPTVIDRDFSTWA